MTSRFERMCYNTITKQEESKGFYTIAIYPQDKNHLTISHGEKYATIKIIDDSDYVFKLQKTQIRARGGAAGLFTFIDDCLSEKFGESWAWKIIDYVLKESIAGA